MDEKRNPPENGLPAEISRGSQKIEALQGRIERYSKARENANNFKDYLVDHKEYVLAGHLINCGNWLLFNHYYTVDQVKLVKASFCKKHLLCQLCAIRRGAKQLKCYLDRFEIIKENNPDLKASLITITVKNGPDLKERFEHLVKGIRLLNQRRRNSKHRKFKSNKSEWSKVLGLVGTYEATNNNENDWHPHTHIIALHHSKIDSDALSKEWHTITKDSFIVDVRPLQNPDNPAKDFCEVFKYALKFSTLSHENNLIAYKALNKRRLIFSAGLFRGVKVPDELTDNPLSDLPYLELFYQFLPGSGYNFKDKSKVPF